MGAKRGCCSAAFVCDGPKRDRGLALIDGRERVRLKSSDGPADGEVGTVVERAKALREAARLTGSMRAPLASLVVSATLAFS